MQPLQLMVWHFLLKLTLHILDNALIGTQLGESLTHVQQGPCVQMFTAVSFTIAKPRKS